ncbi:hypothetical protein QOT17_004076 [Balamuthia mandrillaris]
MMLKTRCTLVVLGVCALIFLAKGDQCESYSTWPTCLDDTEAKCHWCSSKNACFSVDSGEDCDNWCDTYDECKNNLCHAHQSCSSCVLDPDFYCHWCTSNDACFLEGEGRRSLLPLPKLLFLLCLYLWVQRAAPETS